MPGGPEAHCFLKDQGRRSKRIDPHSCKLNTFLDDLDPYGITGQCGSVGRNFVVWDDNSNGEIEAPDLSPEQGRILRERIEREAKKPVLHSLQTLGWHPNDADAPSRIPRQLKKQTCN